MDLEHAPVYNEVGTGTRLRRRTGLLILTGKTVGLTVLVLLSHRATYLNPAG